MNILPTNSDTVRPSSDVAAPSDLPARPAVKQSAAPPVIDSAVTHAAKTQELEEVTKAVEQINQSLQTSAQNLQFSVDSDSKRVVVKIVDLQTQTVLRQIPNAEVLEIAKSLDKLQGILIRQQA